MVDSPRDSNSDIRNSIPREAREGVDKVGLESLARDTPTDGCEGSSGVGHSVAIPRVLTEDSEEGEEVVTRAGVQIGRCEDGGQLWVESSATFEERMRGDVQLRRRLP